MFWCTFIRFIHLSICSIIHWSSAFSRLGCHCERLPPVTSSKWKMLVCDWDSSVHKHFSIMTTACVSSAAASLAGLSYSCVAIQWSGYMNLCVCVCICLCLCVNPSVSVSLFFLPCSTANRWLKAAMQTRSGFCIIDAGRRQQRQNILKWSELCLNSPLSKKLLRNGASL